MPRSCWWSVVLLFVCCFFLGCSGPPESVTPSTEETSAYELDPAILEPEEDPITRGCRASMDDDPRSTALTQEQFDTLLNRCVVRTEAQLASAP